MLGVHRSYCDQISKKIFHLILTILTCVTTISCGPTVAQRQSTSMQEGAQVASQNMKTCVSKIFTNPAYQNFAKHMPLNGSINPTLEQLADDGIPNDEDVQVIISIHNEMAPCREQLIEDTMKIMPGLIPTFLQFYNASDLIMVDLIQRKITWGEANKKRSVLTRDFMVKIQEAASQIDRDLAASHQAELAQRQAALNALGQWATQQQVLMQNQEMINSLNRPVITNCTGSGSSINCISQ